jgi:hypothetical protein
MVGPLAQLEEMCSVVYTYNMGGDIPEWQLAVLTIITRSINRAVSGPQIHLSILTTYGQADMVEILVSVEVIKLEWRSSRMKPPIRDDSDWSPENPSVMLLPGRDIFLLLLLSTLSVRFGRRSSCLFSEERCL